jgi:YD repeat-containing protein
VERGVWADAASWDDSCEAQIPRSSAAASETFEELQWLPGGLLSRQKNGSYFTVALAYDGYGRLLERRYGDKSRERFGYDQLGRLTSIAKYAPGATNLSPGSGFAAWNAADPFLVAARSLSYDARDRLVREESPWFYDGADGVRQPLGGGRVVRTTNFYDAERRARIKDADGLITDLYFDRLGRPVQVKAADQVALTLAYSNKGRDVAVSMPAPVPGGVLKRKVVKTDFGALKRIEGATGTVIRSVDYYDDGLTKRGASPGGVLDLTYTPFGELATVSRVTNAGGSEVFVVQSHDRNGLLSAVADGLGHETRYERDHADRVTALVYPDASRATDSFVAGSYAIASRLDRNGGRVSYAYVS